MNSMERLLRDPIRHPPFRAFLTRRLRPGACDEWDWVLEDAQGNWIAIAVGQRRPPVQGDEVEVHFFDARNVRTIITSFDLLEVSATLVRWSVELDTAGPSTPTRTPAPTNPRIMEDKT